MTDAELEHGWKVNVEKIQKRNELIRVQLSEKVPHKGQQQNFHVVFITDQIQSSAL